MFYFARCMNLKYDVHTTRKIKFVHAIIYHVIILCVFPLPMTYVTVS